MAKIGTAQVTRIKIAPWSINGFATARGDGATNPLTRSINVANNQAKPVELSGRCVFNVISNPGVTWNGSFSFILSRTRGGVTIHSVSDTISGTGPTSFTISAAMVDMSAAAGDTYTLEMGGAVSATQGSATLQRSGVIAAQYHKV